MQAQQQLALPTERYCLSLSVAAGELEMRVFDTPGHTRGHVTFWFPEAKSLFPGKPGLPSTDATSQHVSPTPAAYRRRLVAQWCGPYGAAEKRATNRVSFKPGHVLVPQAQLPPLSLWHCCCWVCCVQVTHCLPWAVVACLRVTLR